MQALGAAPPKKKEAAPAFQAQKMRGSLQSSTTRLRENLPLLGGLLADK